MRDDVNGYASMVDECLERLLKDEVARRRAVGRKLASGFPQSEQEEILTKYDKDVADYERARKKKFSYLSALACSALPAALRIASKKVPDVPDAELIERIVLGVDDLYLHLVQTRKAAI